MRIRKLRSMSFLGLSLGLIGLPTHAKSLDVVCMERSSKPAFALVLKGGRSSSSGYGDEFASFMMFKQIKATPGWEMLDEKNSGEVETLPAIPTDRVRKVYRTPFFEMTDFQVYNGQSLRLSTHQLTFQGEINGFSGEMRFDCLVEAPPELLKVLKDMGCDPLL